LEFSHESSRFQGFIENSCTAVRSNVVNEGFTKGRQSGLSLVACISSDELLGSNLLASPSLRAGSPHELALVKNGLSAADGLNLGIERASHPWVVCLHQDVFLPQGWDRQLQRQLETATRQFGPIGVAGTYGVSAPREVQPESEATDTLSDGAGQPHVNSAKFAVNRIGRVIHRGHTLFDGPDLPARVATLDELLLVVPRDTPLRFDPALGFHLYGADICLQAQERGLAVVVLNAICHHNTQTVGLPKAFFRSAGVFAEKWAHRLPVATPCVVIDQRRRVWVLGGARRDHRARAELEG
jgi:hypothetical protein